MKYKIGLIGSSGVWAKNYLKLADQLNIEFLTANRDDWRSFLSQCQGVIISTPPQSHVEIAIEILKCNLPVMIEKPLSLTLSEALTLKEYENNAPILVNYLHLFAPAFEKINNLINHDSIIKFRSIGCNKGPYRDYSPLFDYGAHDVAMGLYLSKNIKDVVTGIISQSKPDLNNSLYSFNIKYGKINHEVLIGNGSNTKIRRFEASDALNTYVYDDLAKNKLTCNDDPIIIENLSPLENSLCCFLKTIDGNIDDDRLGLDISYKTTQILEAFNKLI
jgi:hypothetical protein